jgi:hypothetical protein
MDTKPIEERLKKLLEDISVSCFNMDELVAQCAQDINKEFEEQLPHWFHVSSFYESIGGCPDIIVGDGDYFLEISGNMRLSINELEKKLPKR